MEAFLKKEYAIFQDCSLSFATYAICAVLMTMVRRKRTKKYIQQLYDDMCFVFDTPEIFGKQITMTDVMDRLEKDYGIDWSKIHIRMETEKHFISSTKKEVRKKNREERQ
jgi:hypothetical protein